MSAPEKFTEPPGRPAKRRGWGMVLRERRLSRVGAALRLKSGKKYPSCPKCRRRMTVKQVAPVLFAADVDDIVFGCEDCGTEVKRTVKRS